MKWNNVESDLKSTSLSDGLGGLGVLKILQVLTGSQCSPFILLSPSIRRKIRDHLDSRNTELGGLLVGRVISRRDLIDGIIFIEVTDSIASTDFYSTPVSLTMGTEVWDKASLESNSQNFVIGWYHSHPNLGAFFSSTDRSTQSKFFNHKYSIGLVIDPIREQESCFIGSDSKELPKSHIITDLYDTVIQ